MYHNEATMTYLLLFGLVKIAMSLPKIYSNFILSSHKEKTKKVFFRVAFIKIINTIVLIFIKPYLVGKMYIPENVDKW